MNTSAKRVLDVGQRGPDHVAIRNLLISRFGAQVDNALTIEQALEMLRRLPYGLVLVSRIIDLDRSEGLDLVRRMRSDATLSGIPVMLVSDYDEAQQEAVEAGAARGFGKSALYDPATEVLLKPHLDTTAYA